MEDITNQQLKKAQKVFATKFGPNVLLTKPKRYGTDKNYFQFFTGVDGQTKFNLGDISNFFGSSSLMVQSITDKNVTEETVQDYLHSSLVEDVGPKGRLEHILRNNIKLRVSPAGNIVSPQIQFLINRNPIKSKPPSPIDTYYYSTWIKLDPKLDEKLLYPIVGSGGSHWQVICEMKTGGYEGNASAGDYRYSVSVNKDENGLYYRVAGDNNANGVGVIPGLSSFTTYWRQRTRSGVVKLGVWLKLEVFIKRPANKDDQTTGVIWVALTPANQQQRVVIGHKVGGVQMGIQNLPVGRLFLVSNYIGGNSPVSIDVTDLEIWNGLPFPQSQRFNNNIMYDY